MLILGLDTCCMPAAAALCDDEKLIAETVINCGRTHSQKIMPQIQTMLEAVKIKCADIDCFAVASGPGSFTGVRIGVATVKALAHATGKPCIAISTLEGLADNIRCFGGIICPILDARREQVYTALFEGGDNMTRLCEDKAVGVDALIEELMKPDYIDKDIMFLGDGVFVYRETIKHQLGKRAKFAPSNLNMNKASSIAHLASKQFSIGSFQNYSEIVPQYIRMSQAERERIEREKS